jgi:flagellar protein FlaJ
MKDFSIKTSRIKFSENLYYFSGILVGLVFILLNLFLIEKLVGKALSSIIYVISAVFIFLPFIIKWYSSYNKIKKLENYFPVFLRDLIESVRSGMTLPQAFKSVSENDYGLLSFYIKKMSHQLDWGIPINKVLINFSKETKSKLIGRLVSTVIESHNFGGNIVDTFEALSKTITEVDKLRRERIIYLQSQIVTGYIVFFVFLAVIIGLQIFLVPSIKESFKATVSVSSAGQSTEKDIEEMVKQYNELYRNLILIQGFFAGLAVGKMSEGSLIAGIKHSLFMMLVGFITFTLIVENPNLIPIPKIG